MRRKNLENNDKSKIARASLSSKLTKHNRRRLEEGDWRTEYTELSTGLLRYMTTCYQEKERRYATPDLALVGLISSSETTFGHEHKQHMAQKRREGDNGNSLEKCKTK